MKVPEPTNICLWALFTTKKNLVNAISPYCARCLQSYPLPLWLSAGVALHKGTCCLLSSWKPLAILLFNPRASCEHHLIMVNVLPGLQLRLLVPHYSSNCANFKWCYLLCHSVPHTHHSSNHSQRTSLVLSVQSNHIVKTKWTVPSGRNPQRCVGFWWGLAGKLRIICDNTWQCSFCCTMDASCILQGPFIVSGIVKTSKMLYYIFL